MTLERRPGSLAGLIPLLALATAVLQGCWLLAAGYERVAYERQGRPGAAGTSPAEVASRLGPWRASPHLLAARSLDAAGADERSLQALREAVRLSPANPQTWLQIVWLQASAGTVGAAMETATARANALAPRSPPVQQTNAQVGLALWYLGTPRLREEWLRSMRFELRRHPNEFRRDVVTSGRLPFFCADAGILLREEKWCRWAGKMVERCAERRLSKQERRTCRWAGFHS